MIKCCVPAPDLLSQPCEITNCPNKSISFNCSFYSWSWAMWICGLQSIWLYRLWAKWLQERLSKSCNMCNLAYLCHGVQHLLMWSGLKILLLLHGQLSLWSQIYMACVLILFPPAPNTSFTCSVNICRTSLLKRCENKCALKLHTVPVTSIEVVPPIEKCLPLV